MAFEQTLFVRLGLACVSMMSGLLAIGDRAWAETPGSAALAPRIGDVSFQLDWATISAMQEEDAAQDPELSETEQSEEDEVFKDETGTDPRDFNNKFMPYYRYTELKNGVEVHDWTIFGLYAFTPRLAMTYEIPIRYMDVSEGIPSFGPPRLPGGPNIPGFGASGPVSDSTEFGLGDSIFRLFYKPKELEWEMDCTWGPKKGETLKWSFMPLLETTVPTNTDSILGNDTWILSPGFAIAGDTPTFGFIAAMFFYDFNAIKDTDEHHVSRIRSRIFLMQPFSKPGPNWNDGLYIMPEFQPSYDFRTNDFSFWFGPEFGKVFDGDTTITIYAKPGWGVDRTFPGDREFTFEAGVRIFF